MWMCPIYINDYSLKSDKLFLTSYFNKCTVFLTDVSSYHFWMEENSSLYQTDFMIFKPEHIIKASTSIF